MRPGSLAIVETKSYPVEGYLKGAIGMEYAGSQYVYLWFSSGSIVLVDGLTTQLLSSFALSDYQQITCMIPFDNGKFIIVGNSDGNLIIISGPQDESIKMIKKVKIPIDENISISNIVLTSRSVE